MWDVLAWHDGTLAIAWWAVIVLVVALRRSAARQLRVGNSHACERRDARVCARLTLGSDRAARGSIRPSESAERVLRGRLRARLGQGCSTRHTSPNLSLKV
jgi:hypothetical protein